MAYIQKQRGKYRARFSDPLGNVSESRTSSSSWRTGRSCARSPRRRLVFVQSRSRHSPPHCWPPTSESFAQAGPDALVFANAAGNPLSASSFLTHHFSKAQKAAGVSCRFHDLRHTSVALAIAAGAHPKAIQSRMGHSSINVTLDRYGHLFPELDGAIAESFDRSFQEATERRARVVVKADFSGG